MKSILLTLISILLVSKTFAVTYIVTNTNDSGTGSLRAAITSANSVFVGTKLITFDIPSTDPGYNAVTGAWTIIPLTVYPMLQSGNLTIDGTTQTANQGNTNPSGPEIIIDGNSTLDHAFLLVTPNNVIKGIVVGRCIYGIQIANNTSSNNLITDCYVGINATGDAAFANGYGITISTNTTNNQVRNCVLSGNTDGGIAISVSSGNIIAGNKIGINPAGTAIVANMNGVAINDATNNIIGGTIVTDRNIISGNISGGIVINTLLSSQNNIRGNYIGTDITGTLRLDNGTGIMIVNSGNNTIGGNNNTMRNIISGNTEAGIILNGTGTRNNIISGNYIGTDLTGTQILYNHVGIMLKSRANMNTIGGTTAGERNLLSGNSEIGIYVEASDSNRIIGNFIGPDVSGANGLKIGDTLFQANGIEFNTVASHNILGGYNSNERNIISGNRVYGMIYYGQAMYDDVIGNYIGTDVTGTQALPNATGICVDGASNHNKIINNLLSGNISYGIFIVTTGTYYNEFKGNLLGTNAAGTDTIPNDIGLLLGGGAKYNMIGGSNPGDRNIFSGNRYEGAEIADNTTDYNTIQGNYFGTDITGMNSLPNQVGLGLATLPAHNTIDGNVISGNHRMGLIIYEQADSNLVINNKIGVAVDGTTQLGNGGTGIILAQGARYNKIGQVGQGNIIAYNDSCGIVVVDTATKYNTISGNYIYENNLLGIEIFPPYINPNDAGDLDNGANCLMNFPVITTAELYSSLTVSGTIDTQNPSGVTIELYDVVYPDPYGHGEGSSYLCSATPDNSGNWSANYTGAYSGNLITAIATDAFGNSSEFAQNSSVYVSVNEIKKEQVSNFKIYPNPVNEKCMIDYFAEENGFVNIAVYSITGEKKFEINNEEKTVGRKSISFNIKQKETILNAGVYIVEVRNNDLLVGRERMVVIDVPIWK